MGISIFSSLGYEANCCIRIADNWYSQLYRTSRGCLICSCRLDFFRSVKSKGDYSFFLQLLEGVASILSALVLFRLFSLIPNLSLPIISAVWITLYFSHYRQSQIIRWLSWLAGITIGWIMFRNLFRNL